MRSRCLPTPTEKLQFRSGGKVYGGSTKGGKKIERSRKGVQLRNDPGREKNRGAQEVEQAGGGERIFNKEPKGNTRDSDHGIERSLSDGRDVKGELARYFPRSR